MKRLSKRSIGIGLTTQRQINAWKETKKEALNKKIYLSQQNASKVQCYDCKKEIPEPAWVQNYWCPDCSLRIPQLESQVDDRLL